LRQHVELPIAVPTLLATFEGMVASEKLQALVAGSETGKVVGQSPQAGAAETKTLTVRIASFSFHQGGPPNDESGHGGGFVFDVRSIPNPGREERFRALCGRDAPVVQYLEAQESTHQFLAHALSLVEASVKDYQRRGFTDLMVSFGCTGGQHRSVYMAEQLAERLRGKAGVSVIVRHTGLEKLDAQKSAGKLGQ
jgi:RNase adaptor protein for sRNA GlmZ degradation